MARSDIVKGAKFGSYTVVGDLISGSRKRGPRVDCECECGRPRQVELRNLTDSSHCLFCRPKRYADYSSAETKILSPAYLAALFDGEGSVGIYKNISDGGFITNITISACWLPTIELQC